MSSSDVGNLRYSGYLKMYLFALICCFLLLVLVYGVERVSDRAKDPGATDQLVLTSILYRHGARNPDGFFPNDPYKNEDYWPDGLGSLTKRGKSEQYELGKWLRKRYESLIPKGKYSKDLVYVQSSDVDRTIMSALANLAGMFYPTKEEMWSDLDWLPIPVHTIPMKMDKTVLVLLCPCPKATNESESLKNSAIVKEFNDGHKDLYNHLSEHAGVAIDDPNKVRAVYTNLLIEYEMIENFKLPHWARGIFPRKLERVSEFGLGMLTMTKTLKRLRGGPLLKDIITHMLEKRDKSAHEKTNFWIYSGHDTSVAALLDTMGAFQPHLPPLSAAVMVDLRKNVKGEYFVSVHYKNSTEESTQLTVPGCTPSCPLDNFISLLSDVIPDDWESECEGV